MFKVLATDVIVSKGYDNSSALKFSEDGNNVRFRIGKRVYDTRAENNQRWLNMAVRAHGALVERIKKMQLKEGSVLHLCGKLDEESWEDPQTKEKKSQIVIVLDEVEYASGGGNKSKDTQNQQNGSNNTSTTPETSSNFEGYTPFGGQSFLDGGF